MTSLNWWTNLELQWKNAFAATVFQTSSAPAVADIEQLHAAAAIRFAGPRAPYPNMSFELTNLSGIAQLYNLEVLVITHHQIKNITGLQALKRLKGLFLFNNQIESLTGIEQLTHLEQLYVQFNQIRSMEPVKQLVHLKEVYIHNNAITTFDGLTEAHSDQLTHFFCRPNEGLKQRAVIDLENRLGIRCRSV